MKKNKKKLQARLAKLEAKLDANLAHFPEEVLKSRYKKGSDYKNEDQDGQRLHHNH